MGDPETFVCRGGAFDTKFLSANFEAGSIEQQHGSRRRNGVRRGAGYSKPSGPKEGGRKSIVQDKKLQGCTSKILRSNRVVPRMPGILWQPFGLSHDVIPIYSGLS